MIVRNLNDGKKMRKRKREKKKKKKNIFKLEIRNHHRHCNGIFNSIKRICQSQSIFNTQVNLLSRVSFEKYYIFQAYYHGERYILRRTHFFCFLFILRVDDGVLFGREWRANYSTMTFLYSSKFQKNEGRKHKRKLNGNAKKRKTLDNFLSF